ncbi:AraC family transcriptional regulator, partial [Streptomyces sp. NPDC052020]
TSDYSVDEVAGRCGFRSPVALRGHFRRQLGSSPAAYRAAYRARRPQGDRQGDGEGGTATAPAATAAPGQAPHAGQPSGPLPVDGAMPYQARRTPAGPVGSPSTHALTAPVAPEHGREYVPSRASVPGPRSAT